MEIGDTYKLGIQRENYNFGSPKISNGNFLLQLNSMNNSEVFLNLQRKFKQVNFEIGDVLNDDETIKAYGNGRNGRFNVIIAPIILKQMEESMSRRIEIENKIFRYINENSSSWFGGFDGNGASSGITFNSDGTVNYWSIPEYEVTNENSKNQNEPNVIYRGENYRGECEANRGIQKEEVIVRRFLYDNTLPLYCLENYIDKNIREGIYNEDTKKNAEQSLLQYLREKFSGVNIHIMDIENNDESLVNYGCKRNWKFNVCIAPVIFNEMEANKNKELEVEEKISNYLNKELEEKTLYKIFEIKPIISGIIFHKDITLTEWSGIIGENNYLQNSSKDSEERKEFIIRQISKDGKFTIRKLENK